MIIFLGDFIRFILLLRIRCGRHLAAVQFSSSMCVVQQYSGFSVGGVGEAQLSGGWWFPGLFFRLARYYSVAHAAGCRGGASRLAWFADVYTYSIY